MQQFINNWSTSLTVAATAEAVSLSVPTLEAAKLVGLGTGDHYLLTLFEVDSLAGQELRREIVRATAVSGGSITVVRAQEGTAAQAWDAGLLIEARLTKETMETLRDTGGGGAPLSNDDPAALGPVSPGASSEASRSDHVHPLPTPAEVGAATSAQGALADTAVQPADLATVATSGDYADLAGKPTIPSAAAEVGAIATTEKGAANGVATLGTDSKIPLAQLPATAITSTSVVANEAAMLALAAQEGDVAIRPDINTSFILAAEPASTLSNWQEILAPSAGGGAPVGGSTPQPLGTATPGVSSSASRQDHVHDMPSAADIGLGNVDNTSDANKPVSTAQQAALDDKVDVVAGKGLSTEDYSTTEKAKLAGIAASATANDTDANLKSRANHTGEQAISTVTGLQTALDAKATNPMTAAGDLIVGGASGAPTRLALGAPLQMPRVNAAGTAIEYADPPSGGGVSLPVVRAITANETLGLAQINTFGVNSTTNNYTSTIPPQSSVAWTDHAEVHYLPTSTGNIVITAGAGVSLNGVVAGSITLSTGFGAASMKRIEEDSWWLGGVAGQTGALGDWCAVGGVVNTYTLTPVVAREIYVTGDQFRARFSVTNTGAMTVNVSGLGVKTCKTVTGANTPAGYIRTDVDTVLTYDGTNFVVGREVEYGSNANGKFWRHADGRLEMSAEVTFDMTVTNSSTNYSYPATPVTSPLSGGIVGPTTVNAAVSADVLKVLLHLQAGNWRIFLVGTGTSGNQSFKLRANAEWY